MKTVAIVSDREIAKRINSIKRTWTKSERDARHVEAERRQQRLAKMLGLKLVDSNNNTLHCAS